MMISTADEFRNKVIEQLNNCNELMKIETDKDKLSELTAELSKINKLLMSLNQYINYYRVIDYYKNNKK
jgi:predicted nuclease of restriction endonuclease-like RecB superfamily